MTHQPYRYILEPYRTPASRYTCPDCGERKRFTRYIDTRTHEHLAEHVGKCDRADNCGYHFTPKRYFEANPDARPQNYDRKWIAPRLQPPDTIPHKVLEGSLKRYSKNYFVQYLYMHFDDETVSRLINNYLIGTSKRWPGATIFWQIDHKEKVRTGKIMLYDWDTGKRVKEPYSHITWVHKLDGSSELRVMSTEVATTHKPPLITQNFNLKQCFFGEHLLADDTSCMVCIVESEKTALIASAFMPEHCWLAAGSLEGLTYDKCRVLQGRNVLLWPDAGAAYTKWEERMKQLRLRLGAGTTFNMARASAQLTGSMDIADFLMGVRVS